MHSTVIHSINPFALDSSDLGVAKLPANSSRRPIIRMLAFFAMLAATHHEDSPGTLLRQGT